MLRNADVKSSGTGADASAYGFPADRTTYDNKSASQGRSAEGGYFDWSGLSAPLHVESTRTSNYLPRGETRFASGST
jgi:hypothetical protein